MNITLCHLYEFEFLLTFNKCLISLADVHRPRAIAGHNIHNKDQWDIPAFQKHQAGVGGVLACGNVSEIRLVHKEMVYNNIRKMPEDSRD